jgi:hypothetical protein
MRMCSTAHGRTPGGDVRHGPAPQRVHRLRRHSVPDVAKAQLAARAIAPAPQPHSLNSGAISLLKAWDYGAQHCTTSDCLAKPPTSGEGPCSPGARWARASTSYLAAPQQVRTAQARPACRHRAW